MERNKMLSMVLICSLMTMLSCQVPFTTGRSKTKKTSAGLPQDPLHAITHTVKVIDSTHYAELESKYGLVGVYGHFTKYLGGLDDDYQYAVGIIEDDSTANLYRLNCHTTARIVLIAEKDGSRKMYKRFQELQTAFAPIESPEEALSFVHLLHGAMPIHEYDDEFEDEINHVEPTTEGYKVNLFHHPPCAHGHVYSTKYLVEISGQVNVISSLEMLNSN